MALPVVRGITLVPPTSLPDKMKSIFPFKLFNAMQSKSFDSVYRSSDNFVLSSPTGSGKTVILELAICRLLTISPNLDFKLVYQAPTKALCAERYRDWSKKFGPFGLNCVEFTGDTDNLRVRPQSAHVIITTPEKWDSITRKWKDHRRFMQVVKLFLIDEVHILKEDRGAGLEAVVSRMKSIGSDVRFVALSATVPNSDDIAKWLGKSRDEPHLPALREVFDETYRPIQVERHVYGFPGYNSNEFSFDKSLNSQIFPLIQRHSIGRPILVFACTRRSAQETAKCLSTFWYQAANSDKPWAEPARQIEVKDPILQECTNYGVGYHHAGLDQQDRLAIETAYLDGLIKVICCTSTLAVGVNLPAQFVVIKNTVAWQTGNAFKELCDLEVMQMLGRAGRPQFDRSAVAVIMTRQEKVSHYQNLMSGQETLESRLHLNLLEHLNAEINLGTIDDAESARKWLEGTFLFVRLAANPGHYSLEGDQPGKDLDERAQRICDGALEKLTEHGLIALSPRIKCTPEGEAMARYCVMFETMKLFSCLQPKARMSEILSAIAQAAEYQGLKLRSVETALYKDINQSPLTKFRINVNLALTGHKVSLILQAILGGYEPRNEKRFERQASQFCTDQNIVFQHASRLVRCMVDCKLAQGDSVAARNAMELSRSIGARAWDDGPSQLSQVYLIGPVAIRKLTMSNITSIEDLAATDAYKIEMALGRNPPFGQETLNRVKSFPQLRVQMRMTAPLSKAPSGLVLVKVSAELGFLNETVPTQFAKKDIYVCLLAESSDGQLLHFYRVSAKTMGAQHSVPFEAHLSSATQLINCYVSCDDIAGTLKSASFNPKTPPQMFKDIASTSTDAAQKSHSSAKGSQAFTAPKKRGAVAQNDDFEVDELDDDDLLLAAAGSSDFIDIDAALTGGHLGEHDAAAAAGSDNGNNDREAISWEPAQLANGKWACSHKCRDKSKCSHLCCNIGMEKKPRVPKPTKKSAAPSSQITSMKGFTKGPRPDAGVQSNPAVKKTTFDASNQRANATKKPSGVSTAAYGDETHEFDDMFLSQPAGPQRHTMEPNVARCSSDMLDDGQAKLEDSRYDELELTGGSGRTREPETGEKRPAIGWTVSPSKQSKKAKLVSGSLKGNSEASAEVVVSSSQVAALPFTLSDSDLDDDDFEATPGPNQAANQGKDLDQVFFNETLDDGLLEEALDITPRVVSNVAAHGMLAETNKATASNVQHPPANETSGRKERSAQESQELADWLHANFGDVACFVHEGKEILPTGFSR